MYDLWYFKPQMQEGMAWMNVPSMGKKVSPRETWCRKATLANCSKTTGHTEVSIQTICFSEAGNLGSLHLKYEMGLSRSLWQSEYNKTHNCIWLGARLLVLVEKQYKTENSWQAHFNYFLKWKGKDKLISRGSLSTRHYLNINILQFSILSLAKFSKAYLKMVYDILPFQP